MSVLAKSALRPLVDRTGTSPQESGPCLRDLGEEIKLANGTGNRIAKNPSSPEAALLHTHPTWHHGPRGDEV